MKPISTHSSARSISAVVYLSGEKTNRADLIYARWIMRCFVQRSIICRYILMYTRVMNMIKRSSKRSCQDLKPLSKTRSNRGPRWPLYLTRGTIPRRRLVSLINHPFTLWGHWNWMIMLNWHPSQIWTIDLNQPVTAIREPEGFTCRKGGIRKTKNGNCNLQSEPVRWSAQDIV